MDNEIYRIPANYTDAGKILGLFDLRNVVEAVTIGIPILFFCAYFPALALTAKIVVTMILLVPATGFALIGINGDSLTRYLKARRVWKKRRRMFTHRGEAQRNGY
jgi:hypothetical protein